VENSKNRLDNIIKKGCFHYILIYGVLFWGVGTAILVSLLQDFTGSPQTITTVAKSLVTFPIAGAFMWFFAIKRRHNKKLGD